MSIPTFHLEDDSQLLGALLIRAADAVRVLEADIPDSDARAPAVEILKKGRA